jgi:hypothetical protein
MVAHKPFKVILDANFILMHFRECPSHWEVGNGFKPTNTERTEDLNYILLDDIYLVRSFYHNKRNSNTNNSDQLHLKCLISNTIPIKLTQEVVFIAVFRESIVIN